MQSSGDVRLDTVGKPMPGVEVTIADSGEVLVRSPGLMRGYYKRPDATAEAIDAAGYFHTGDAGFFDADGHLVDTHMGELTRASLADTLRKRFGVRPAARPALE